MITFLEVPYIEKDQAKALGARWNPEKKKWYVKDMEDLRPFMRWMPNHLIKPHKKPAPAKKQRHFHGITVGKDFVEAYTGDLPPWIDESRRALKGDF
jgi:hypothetical protein